MRKGLITFIASGFGLGYIPKAPGTFGTVLGVVLAFFIPDNLLFVTGVSVFGVWVSNEAEIILEEHDSPKIVIDEIAGFLIATYSWQGYYSIAAFILFRVFDILKPWPLKNLQKLPGGLGIMVDDIVAGLLANISLILITYIFGI